MTWASAPPSVWASARIPASLRAPRTVPAGAITRSLGHLITTGRPEAACRPSAMATPVARVRACTQSPTVPCCASSTTETYSPAPAGEYHWCPPRPRPAVCWPAMTRVPSGVPCAASFAARSLVDEATGKYRTRDPSGVASPCVRACSSPSARPTGTDAAPIDLGHDGPDRLEFERDVGRVHRVRQRADRHEVRARRRQLRNAAPA